MPSVRLTASSKCIAERPPVVCQVARCYHRRKFCEKLPMARKPQTKPVTPLAVSRAMNTLLEGAYWPRSLATMATYTRTQDDTDGETTPVHDLDVTIGVDGDVWVQAPKLLRFRLGSGGGHSLRVRNALLVLAEAIRRDNEEHPQAH